MTGPLAPQHHTVAPELYAALVAREESKARARAAAAERDAKKRQRAKSKAARKARRANRR